MTAVSVLSPKKSVLTQWKSVFFHAFIVPMPVNWDYNIQDGKIKAKEKKDEIRLTISGWSIDKTQFTGLNNAIDAMKNGYLEAGYSISGDLVNQENLIIQKMALGGEPCCILASMHKEYNDKVIILNFTFNTYDEIELNANANIIEYMLNNVSVRLG